MADKSKGPGFETAGMALPAMDRPSVVFAWFMDGMIVETDGVQLWLTCAACGDGVIAIEDGDSLRTIFNTALAHRC